MFCLLFRLSRQTKQIRLFVFRENLRRAKTASCFIWPLVMSNKIEIFFQIFLAFSKYLNFKIIWSSCCNFTTWINPQGTILQKSVGTPISNPISKFYQQIVDISIKRLGLVKWVLINYKGAFLVFETTHSEKTKKFEKISQFYLTSLIWSAHHIFVPFFPINIVTIFLEKNLSFQMSKKNQK